MGQQPESQIIQKAMNGDMLAFRCIIENLQPMVYKVAFRFMQNVHDTEDVVQDAFIRLWKNLYSYNGKAKLTTWMYRIVVNLCIDQIRAKGQPSVELHNSITDPNPLVTDKMEAREMMDNIHRAASMLTPKQQSAFLLRDLEGLSVEESCQILNVSEKQLKANLYHARKKIREILAKNDEVHRN